MGSANKKPQSKEKKGRPPPVDKLLKPAIGVAIALLAYQFLKGLGSEVRYIILLALVFYAAESVLTCPDFSCSLPS